MLTQSQVTKIVATAHKYNSFEDHLEYGPSDLQECHGLSLADAQELHTILHDLADVAPEARQGWISNYFVRKAVTAKFENLAQFANWLQDNEQLDVRQAELLIIEKAEFDSVMSSNLSEWAIHTPITELMYTFVRKGEAVVFEFLTDGKLYVTVECDAWYVRDAETGRTYRKANHFDVEKYEDSEQYYTPDDIGRECYVS